MYSNNAAVLQWRQNASPARPVLRRGNEWSEWLEVKVKVYGLPAGTTALELHRVFGHKGRLLRIEIFDKRNFADAEAIIVFSPAPNEAFWEAVSFRFPIRRLGTYGRVRLELLPPPRTFFHPSPVSPGHSYRERMAFAADTLDFGLMLSEATMMVMKTVEAADGAPIQLVLNLLRRQLEVQFSFPSNSDPNANRDNCKYQFRVPLTKLERVYNLRLENGRLAFIIPLEMPPEFYLQTNDVEATHDDESTLWTEWRTWSRQTYIDEDPARLNTYPTRLGRSRASIDIGSWTTYRLVFDKKKINTLDYETMLTALRDYNVSTPSEKDNPIELQGRHDSPLWSLLDLSEKRYPGAASGMSGLKEMELNLRHLPFPIRFQLEACLSQGCLNEYNINEDFIRKLTGLDDYTAINLLEKVTDMKRRFFNPMGIFGIPVSRASAGRRVPEYCYEARTATVTPTKIYFGTPVVEIQNRVVRKYREYSDRFLRVKFSDEINNGRINAIDDDTQEEIFERIKGTMRNGIIVGDRKFEFLAFGNSQFREHGAFFFASTPELTASDVREWMGWDDVKKIKNVAKKCARLGQCLSTTRKINLCQGLDIRYIADETSRDGTYCFTDGVGKISPFPAHSIATELGIPTLQNDLPSVFQFRLGGAKGVLAIDPTLIGRTLCLRQSQEKFESKHKDLEIIRVSQFAAATTNRQLLILLSYLGVPDEVLRGKLHDQLTELNRAMNDEQSAVQLLQKNVDFNQMTLTLAGMINDGFMKVKDPFVMSMLQLWRSWSIKYLKEKAKIFIDQGACLLGCVDELGVLQGHFNALKPPPRASREEKEQTLPEIFVRVDTGRQGECKVIEGLCILCRNPSLHPGDIRVVRAVNKPELYHLKNVVVLPRTGDRDLASMCSGGDLDGDDYLVIWDQELVPAVQHWNYMPMDFTPNTVAYPDREPTVDDMINFFVTYMKNDRLPTIAHAHLARADYSSYGPNDSACLELARLHSDAVDYPKSGVPVNMRRALRPLKWPHFMEKKNQPADKIYKSEKILGQLYDMVEIMDFSPQFQTPFDSRILDAYNLDDEMLQQAAEIKVEYDAGIKRIMAQHAIGTEFEVWSTFCLSHNFEKRDYGFAEELGRVTSALKDCFRKVCISKAGGPNFEHLGPFVAAMYNVTAREVGAFIEALEKSKADGNDADDEATLSRKERHAIPFMSFPWIFDRELGKIANGLYYRHGSVNTFHGMPDLRSDMQPRQGVNLNLEEASKAEIIDGIRREMELPKAIDVQPMDKEHGKMIESGIQGPRMRNTMGYGPVLPSRGTPVEIKKPSYAVVNSGTKFEKQSTAIEQKNDAVPPPLAPSLVNGIHTASHDDDDDDPGIRVSQIQLESKPTGLDRLANLLSQEL